MKAYCVFLEQMCDLPVSTVTASKFFGWWIIL